MRLTDDPGVELDDARNTLDAHVRRLATALIEVRDRVSHLREDPATPAQAREALRGIAAIANEAFDTSS